MSLKAALIALEGMALRIRSPMPLPETWAAQSYSELRKEAVRRGKAVTQAAPDLPEAEAYQRAIVNLIHLQLRLRFQPNGSPFIKLANQNALNAMATRAAVWAAANSEMEQS